jgi:protein-tyrosine-phosphatase
VRAVPAAVAALGIAVPLPPGRVLFVCTHNSARSQLAAALWRRRFSAEAESAGTHPAGEIHPGAVAAAQRAGLTLPGPGPRHLATVAPAPDLVVTVCDRAHEELDPREDWWHWSVADPVTAATAASFDAALADIDDRIDALHRGATWN